jgi:hypothetical protein
MPRPIDTSVSAVARKEFLDIAHTQFRASENEADANRKEFKTDLEFLNLKQWDENVVKIRKGVTGHDKPVLTMDQIGEPYRQLRGRQQVADPAIQVNPAGDGADKETAEIFQGLIRHYGQTGHAKEARDEAFKGSAGPGLGYYALLVEDEAPETHKQTITYRQIENVFTVYDDPLAKGALKRDRRFLYLIQDLPKDEFERLYPKAKYKAQSDFMGSGDKCDLPDWYPEGHVRVAERWYIDYETVGSVALLSDGREVPTEQAEAMVAASQMGASPGAVLNLRQAPAAIEIVRTKPVTKRVVKWAKISGAEILDGNHDDDVEANTEGRLWPGSMIPFIRVCGERLVVDGKEVLSGIVRGMRDPQRLYNFNASEYAHELTAGPKTRVIMAEGQQEGHETQWENPERRDRPYYLYKPTTIDGTTTAAAPPQIAQFTDSAKLIALLQAMNQNKMDLKSASGYYDSADPSRKNSEQSAKAIQARKLESQESSIGYVDHYQGALTFEGELLIDLIPKIIMPGQILRVLDLEGEATQVMARQPFKPGEDGQPQPLGPGEQFQKGLHQFFDPTVGKFDVTVTIGSSYSTKRKESFDTAMQLVSANPALMGVIGDLVIEQSDMPMAAAIAERLKKTLPPALQSDDKDSHIPPAVAAQVNQLKQQAGTVIEHLTQIVQKLEEEKAAKSQELAAKVEIARMDNTVKLRIAEMTAKNAEAEARAEALAQRIEGLLQHAHEVGLMAEEQAHEKEMAERQHQQGLEAGAQQHAQGMESAAAQAALEPQPEAGA